MLLSKPDSLYIGIDIGTSSVKAIMGGPGAGEVDAFSASYPTHRPVAGAAEQHPLNWLDLACGALGQFAAHPHAKYVRAIGLTSQVNTHVFCDSRGAHLFPALTWQDTRAAQHAEHLEAQIDPSAKIAALGAPIPIDASHALARMAWIAATFPEVWAMTRHVLLPKDYLIAQLTGEFVSDPIGSVGLVGPALDYAELLLEIIPEAASLLPKLDDPLHIAGTIRHPHPFAGIPVAVGTMDAWSSMFGLGVVGEGEAMYLSGTSDVLGLISARGSGTAGIVTFPDWRGIRLHAGPTQSGGSSLTWLAALLGQEMSSVLALASPEHIRKESPLFLPHLDGERAPLWDPHSRGAFVGLDKAIGPAEIVAALMEGVAFAARLALEAIEVSGNQQIESLCHGGGGAQSGTWCQIRADVLGRHLACAASKVPGATGALVMASLAAGEMNSLREATQGLVTRDRVFSPTRTTRALCDERFGIFRDIYHALSPINHALTESLSR